MFSGNKSSFFAARGGRGIGKMAIRWHRGRSTQSRYRTHDLFGIERVLTHRHQLIDLIQCLLPASKLLLLEERQKRKKKKEKGRHGVCVSESRGARPPNCYPSNQQVTNRRFVSILKILSLSPHKMEIQYGM
jgi:hypothetical protein